ncbi:MAG: RNA-binding S4 domain-containing protein [Bacilli bacterium]|jgi:ribosomal 50S subunit-recycling heat shock protein
MRLDRYLKVSRLIKRRTVAKEIADGGSILANGKVAKPSTDIKIGDELELRLGRHLIGVKVLLLLDHAGALEAETMYEVLYQDSMSERRS